MRDDEEALYFLSKLAPLNDDLFTAAERYVCKMYVDKTCTSVNSLRKLFWKHFRTKGKM